MIKTCTIKTPNQDELILELRSPEKSGFFINSIEGLGYPNVNVFITDSLYNDGGYYNSSRIPPRNITISLGFYNDGQESIESIRQLSYKFFPPKVPLEILIETQKRLYFYLTKISFSSHVQKPETSGFRPEGSQKTPGRKPTFFLEGLWT